MVLDVSVVLHSVRCLEQKDLTFDNEIAISDKNNHFRFGLWGGMQINGNYKEFDYYVQYSNNILFQHPLIPV